ncbi:hypothetical protein CLV24_11510 [Pontibacter ummariensis]|uniref:Uncharacterized protein n=1 Tax=Pontibacter ummariensis TaxID=1610492 RepID=A0A239HWJ6_9BACT|nr:hypothetical protein [Pontibacter ummariensis]PRY10093.1 hypothetical protein CLV24_11510 [Pontibacter ummariensis]SNS85689.1 hypothetical protein SAMN06296052_11510 [Pontibacter ummariensis]
MNRKYLVDKDTRVYLCVALHTRKGWEPTNQESLQPFMDSCPAEDETDARILAGEFSDNTFFEKWIRNGTNFLFRY